MITLVLPSGLRRLVGTVDGGPGPAVTWPSAEPGSWAQFVTQLRQHFPDLAARVIADSGQLSGNVACFVNGSGVRDFEALQIQRDDAVAFVPIIAGG